MKSLWFPLKRKLFYRTNKIWKKNGSKRRGGKINLLESKRSFSLSEFRHILNMEVIRSSEEEIVIQIDGIDFSIINSLRRVLLGETASFAIHKVFFYDNSSILNDEIIAHRLCLVPLFFPPDLIDFFLKKNSKLVQKLIFELKITRPQNFNKGFSVFSNSLKWKSYGLLSHLLKNSQIKPVFRDILVLKLNPGQKIKCECHCVLGKGTTHAKFSPVGTTFYRIFPRIKITQEILGKNAKNFFKKCPVKVFDIEKCTITSLEKLIVSSPGFCTFCKECLTVKVGNFFPIRIGRVKNKVSFVIESTGVLSPEILFHRAIFLLVGKCNEALSSLYDNFSLKTSNFKKKSGSF